MSWKISWRNLMRKKLRTFFTFIAILLGVSTMVSVISTVDTTQEVIEKRIRLSQGDADFVVMGTNYSFEDRYSSKIQQTEGVSDTLSLYSQQAELKKASLDQLDTITGRVRLMGVDSIDSSMLDLSPVKGDLKDEGIVLNETTARLWNTKVGDKLTFQLNDESRTIRVAAIVNNSPLLSGPTSWEGADAETWKAVIPLDILQDWIDAPNQVQEILVKQAEGVDPKRLQDRLTDRIDDNEVYAQPVVIDEKQTEQLDELYLLFYVMGGLAMFISAFVLFNTLYVSVTERKKEFAIMKALGYTPAQVGKAVFLEVMLLAVLGTGIGILLGIQMAYGLQSLLLSAFDANITYDMEWGAALPIAASLGILIPLVATVIPVNKARKVSVVYALNDNVPEKQKDPILLRGILGLLLISGVFIDHPIAFLFLFVGATLVFPYLLKAIRWLITPFNRLVWGYEGLLGSRNVSRNANRIANMAAILSFGICLTLVIHASSLSVNEKVEEQVTQSFGGNLQLQLEKPIEQEDINEIRQIDGIDGVTTYQEAPVLWRTKDQNRRFMVVNADKEWMSDHPLFSPTDGDLDELINQLNANTVVLGQYAFDQWGGSIGDSIEFETLTGKQSVKVVGVVETSKYGGYVAFTSNQSNRSFEDGYGISYANHALITLADNGKENEVKDRLFDQYGAEITSLNPLSRAIESQKQTLQEVFGLFNSLLLLAVLISGIGIINTLLMNVMERIREIGMMRGIGCTNGQIRKMIMSEGMFIGLTGCIVGIALGTGVIYLNSISENFDLDFIIPWRMMAVAGGLGILVSLLASVLPAFRATRVRLIEALKYE